MDSEDDKKLIVDKRSLHLGGNVVGGDPCCWTPGLWDWLIGNYNVKRVLDVGCGEGHALNYFREKGCEAFGIEGLEENVKKNTGIHLWDLTKGPVVVQDGAIDLVWCCEVVEHIEEKYLDNLIGTFRNGRILAMTHALPGQEGWHHVNCQPPGYWVNVLKRGGFDFLQDDTHHARSLVSDNNFFFTTGLIFRRREI